MGLQTAAPASGFSTIGRSGGLGGLNSKSTRNLAAIGGVGDLAASGGSSTSSTRASTAGPSVQTLSGPAALLEWSKDCVKNYENVSIQNFQLSWKDGLAFCALVHAHYPRLIDWEKCKTMKPLDRLNLAFEAAASVGVPSLLDAEDVCDIDVPEKLSMITYIGVLFRGFSKTTPIPRAAPPS